MRRAWSIVRLGGRSLNIADLASTRFIVFAATHHRGDIWLGLPTIKAILANNITPSRIDKYLAKAGYSGQLSDHSLPSDAPSNLFEPVPGDSGAHGRSDSRAADSPWTMFTDRHRTAFCVSAAGVVALLGLHLFARKENI